MKKTLSSFILTVAISVSPSAKAYAGDYYTVGIDAFKKGSYEKATSNLEHAVRNSPKNVNARYYLAQTYLRQNRISDATDQYSRIIFLAPSSDAAILSEQGLYLIKKSYVKGSQPEITDGLAKYGDNYIAYILSDNKVYKWESFPINVYIEPKGQKGSAKLAFEQWQSKSSNLVRFNYVSSPEKAQIVVKFNNSLGIVSSEKEAFTAGLSKPFYEGDYIKKSEINILATNPKTNLPLDDNTIYATALHEIGHSLGLQGHSPNENDVMFASSKEPRMNLSQRDLNTLNLFYKGNPNSLLAKNSGSSNLKLQQAIKYTKDYPNKASGWAGLGDVYRGKKMYTEALKSYKQAISIEPSNAGNYNLLGTTYLEMGNKQNALANLKTACDLDKSNTFYLYQFTQLCWETGQKTTGRNYVKAYVKAHPESITDEKMRTLLNLYK